MANNTPRERRVSFLLIHLFTANLDRVLPWLAGYA